MARKKTHKEFIEEVKIIHPDLKILDEYIGRDNKILVQDKLGIKYLTKPDYLILGKHPCISSALDVENAFKIKSENVHGIGVYDYSLVEYKGNKTKVKIICQKHGEFMQSPNSHMRHRGCPKCGTINSNKKITLNNKEFIRRSKKTHGDKYDYSLVYYKDSKTKVKIICSKHGEFNQVPYYHVYGNGCPNCSKSKGQLEVERILNEYNINYETEKTFKGCKFKRLLRFDTYLPELNFLIEYDGLQHFEPVFGGEKEFLGTQKRDKIKNEFCKKESIPLLRIPYTQFNEIENLISNFIKQKMAGI